MDEEDLSFSWLIAVELKPTRKGTQREEEEGDTGVEGIGERGRRQ